MKWRNQILALICLLVFAGLGILYFQNWVVQKPFAIILFIGEGLTAQRLTAARVYSASADGLLTIDAFEFSARVRNYSADFAVPDSAAAGTAFATGIKVKNGALSVDESGAPLQTILEIAHDAGRSTGIVSDGALTNPAMAAFYAHAVNAKQPKDLANALLDRGVIDVALGGGGSNFQEATVKERIRVARTLSELEGLSGWQRSQVLGIFSDGDFPFSDDLSARTEKPSLSDMVRRAIELLQVNRRGYLLVVNAHLMASAAWQNQGERTLRETIELDRAVQTAREYAGPNLAVIVVGDAAIGGMNVNGYPFRYDRGVAILGLNSSGQPWITWATGPNGGKPPESSSPEGERSLKAVEPAAIEAPAALSTVEDMVASANGARTERVRGTIENTEIFAILRDAL